MNCTENNPNFYRLFDKPPDLKFPCILNLCTRSCNAIYCLSKEKNNQKGIKNAAKNATRYPCSTDHEKDSLLKLS